MTLSDSDVSQSSAAVADPADQGRETQRRQRRPSLADGPAVRAALALAAYEASGRHASGEVATAGSNSASLDTREDHEESPESAPNRAAASAASPVSRSERRGSAGNNAAAASGRAGYGSKSVPASKRRRTAMATADSTPDSEDGIGGWKALAAAREKALRELAENLAKDQVTSVSRESGRDMDPGSRVPGATEEAPSAATATASPEVATRARGDGEATSAPRPMQVATKAKSSPQPVSSAVAPVELNATSPTTTSPAKQRGAEGETSRARASRAGESATRTSRELVPRPGPASRTSRELVPRSGPASHTSREPVGPHAPAARTAKEDGAEESRDLRDSEEEAVRPTNPFSLDAMDVLPKPMAEPSPPPRSARATRRTQVGLGPPEVSPTDGAGDHLEPEELSLSQIEVSSLAAAAVAVPSATSLALARTQLAAPPIVSRQSTATGSPIATAAVQSATAGSDLEPEELSLSQIELSTLEAGADAASAATSPVMAQTRLAAPGAVLARGAAVPPPLPAVSAGPPPLPAFSGGSPLPPTAPPLQHGAPAPGVPLPVAGPQAFPNPSGAARPQLSSDLFATVHDTVAPPAVARILDRLPVRLRELPRGLLIGLASLVLVACSVPLLLIAVAVGSSSDEPAPGPGVAKSSVATATAASPVHHEPSPRSTPAQRPLPDRSAAEGDIPWTFPGAASTPSCSSLVETVAAGPSGYRLQQAIKRSQTELIRGRVEEAHAALCEAKLLGASSPAALLGLAQVLLMRDDPGGALKVVDEFLEQQPTSATARDLRGDALVRLGRVEAARGEWFRAAGAAQGSASVVADLLRANRAGARSAVRAGDLSRADRMLRRVIALDPRDADAAAQLARALHKAGKSAAARRWYDFAVTLDADHPNVRAVGLALAGD